MIAGLVLAGGRGSRLGGCNKALLTLGGETLLKISIRRLETQVAFLAISANDPLPSAITGACDTLPDADDSRPGPLGGILAGLAWAQGRGATHLVSIAVDTPRFPADLVMRLADGDPAQIAVATSAGRPHPTFALWPVELQSALDDLLNREQGRRVMDFINRHPHRIVGFEAEPDPFFNINTAEDLEMAESLANG